MKHDMEFPVEYLRQRDLPDAPMAMPTQTIERNLPLFGFVRLLFRVRFRRA